MSTLVILPCHGVFDPAVGRSYAEHPEDLPVYERQIAAALEAVEAARDEDPLLVVSGGATKLERRCSESRSYVEWAERAGLRLPAGFRLEEYALTSVENLVFGLCSHVMARGAPPARLMVVSWAFKQPLFAAAHGALRRWSAAFAVLPELEYVPVGDLSGAARASADAGQRRYADLLSDGLDAYYRDAAVRALIARRDVYASRDEARRLYSRFALPF
jgi:hypothetical protein